MEKNKSKYKLYLLLELTLRIRCALYTLAYTGTNCQRPILGWGIDIIMLCYVETNLKSDQNCDSDYQRFEINAFGNNTKGSKRLL